MFDIGWSEVLVIATVAIVVVGPKDLPRMLRTFGKTMGTVRRTANDFKRQFDDALREAEREVDLADTRKELKALVGDPLAETKKDFDKTMRDAAAQPASGKAVAKAGEAPVVPSSSEAIHPAEPLKGADAGSQAEKPAAPTDAAPKPSAPTDAAPKSAAKTDAS